MESRLGKEGTFSISFLVLSAICTRMTSQNLLEWMLPLLLDLPSVCSTCIIGVTLPVLTDEWSCTANVFFHYLWTGSLPVKEFMADEIAMCWCLTSKELISPVEEFITDVRLRDVDVIDENCFIFSITTLQLYSFVSFSWWHSWVFARAVR